MSKTGYYTVWLPYFKQGDDLGEHLGKEKSIPDAFRAHATMMGETVAILERLAKMAEDVSGLEVDADTHHIGISGPEEKLDPFCEGDDAFLERSEFDEDFDDSEEN